MSITRHQYEVYVRAPREQVWQAILDPAFTKAYFHGTSWDRPPVQGEPFSTSLPDGRPAVDGVVEVLDPPHRLVHTWHTLYDAELAAEPVSRVEWILEEAGEGFTLLRLVHSDLAQSPRTWASTRHGWTWILDSLKSLLETGSPLPDAPVRRGTADDPDGDWHRAEAADAFNATWELIESQRGLAEDEEMLRRAYASAYHWARAAGRTPVNAARSEWLLARTHLLVGDGTTSLRYADRCLVLCEQHGIGDLDLAYAHEARSRALTALGRDDDAAEALATARGVHVEDPEDRAAVARDLAAGG